MTLVVLPYICAVLLSILWSAPIWLIAMLLLVPVGMITTPRRKEHHQQMKKRHSHHEIDYLKINAEELKLGLPLSNYRDKGVDGTELIEATAKIIEVDNQKVIEEIDRQLHPEAYALRDLDERIMAAYAVPSHLMSGCPACGHAEGWGPGPHKCGVCGWQPSMANTAIGADALQAVTTGIACTVGHGQS